MLEPLVLASSSSSDPQLIRAMFSQLVELMQELLAVGKVPNFARESDEATPLILAEQFVYTAIADILIEGGANPNLRLRQYHI